MTKNQWTCFIEDSNMKGRGAHGKVYVGYNTRKVAIKEFQNIKLARKEFGIMKEYGNGKFLPQYYDFFIMNRKAYIVMEYIGGNTLGTTYFESKGKKRPLKISINITINILRALNRLHSSGYAHMDIIPKNIMINGLQPHTVKLIDFSIAEPLTQSTLQNDLRQAAHMCIFLINGRVPIEKRKPNNIKPFAMSNTNLKKVLMVAIKPTKKKRYRSAQDFINALKVFT
ncbi:protein kinase [Halalkalibacter kiskunsagensis]|uniref:Protein kinase n=1 Tax=Halalkalibacter kiskunsagensis TaxID=1548599 RepID=A0ABV6K9P9_9BACI